MLDQPKKNNPRFFFRLSSIRSRLIFVTGAILILAFMIAIIGYISLYSVQQTVQTSMRQAIRVRELSSGIQNEFLQARQNEAALLYTWRRTGYGVQESIYVIANENHLVQARNLLDQMEMVVASSKDPSVQSLQEEIGEVRPLMDAYETAFQVTVNDIRERVRPDGQESQLANDLVLLEDATRDSPDPALLNLLSQIRTNEFAYYATGKQRYIDQVTQSMESFMASIRTLPPEQLEGATLTKSQIIVTAQAYLRIFNLIVTKEINAGFNRDIFAKVNDQIIQSITMMDNKSSAGYRHAEERLSLINRQASAVLLLTAGLALVLGIIAATLLNQSIIPPLNQLIKAAQRMGEGDLTQHVNVGGGSELIRLGNSFNAMANQLNQTLEGLEQRVADRTKDLERRTAQLQVAAEIAREATSVRELDKLLNQAVNLVNDRFGFYHAGIFLTDARGEYAVLHAATGEAGRQMLEQRHRLKVGETSIVGNVCSTSKPRISLDVGIDAVFIKNPLLRETRSEMALPLKVGKRTIGALDVQSTAEAAFDQEDLTVLQTMADQLAIAIDNARLFKEAQDNLQQLQFIYGRYGHEAWEHQRRVRKLAGYEYDPSGARPILETEEGTVQSRATSVEEPAFSLPLQVRGQTIGVLDIWPEQEEQTPIDKAMLQTLSDRISQAMESARLFEETRAHAANEQMLSQLTARFARSIGMSTLLQTAAHELGHLPNVNEVSIHIGVNDAATSPHKNENQSSE